MGKSKTHKAEFPKSFETFREPKEYFLSSMKSNEPSSFNGFVEIRKYKITIELIEEPIEVIQDRILKLWEECDNIHHWEPLKNKAKQYGLDLDSRRYGINKTKTP